MWPEKEVYGEQRRENPDRQRSVAKSRNTSTVRSSIAISNIICTHKHTSLANQKEDVGVVVVLMGS